MAGDRDPPPPPSGADADHAAASARAALVDAPPFLSWTGIYAIVLGALAAQVILCAILAAAYR